MTKTIKNDSAVLRTYSGPVLSIYGNVVHLTASGTKGTPENQRDPTLQPNNQLI